MKFKYRVKFTKGDGVKYISHLDVMRIFQRALKRGDIPVSYSQGFNPHQLLSFAHPLSLGYTSEGEYGDFEIQVFMEPDEIKKRLNETLPFTMDVKEVVALGEKAGNAMASVEGAEYTAVLDRDIMDLDLKIKEFMNQKEIIAVKKTKKSTKETDIKPDILDIKDVSENGKCKIYMFLAAGSNNNVRADLVLESLYSFIGEDFDKYKIRFCREDLFRNDGKNLVRLNVGVE